MAIGIYGDKIRCYFLYDRIAPFVGHTHITLYARTHWSSIITSSVSRGTYDITITML